MAITDMVRDLLSQDMVDIMDRHMSMKTVSMVLMVTMAMVAMDMARELLNQDMVDIMDRLMSMKTVSMVLMVTMAMEVMDMVRELLMKKCMTDTMMVVITQDIIM